MVARRCGSGPNYVASPQPNRPNGPNRGNLKLQPPASNGWAGFEESSHDVTGLADEAPLSNQADLSWHDRGFLSRPTPSGSSSNVFLGLDIGSNASDELNNAQEEAR